MTNNNIPLPSWLSHSLGIIFAAVVGLSTDNNFMTLLPPDAVTVVRLIVIVGAYLGVAQVTTKPNAGDPAVKLKLVLYAVLTLLLGRAVAACAPYQPPPQPVPPPSPTATATAVPTAAAPGGGLATPAPFPNPPSELRY